MTLSDDLYVACSFSGKQWASRPYLEKDARAISQYTNVPEIIARLLASRGIDYAEAELFLNPTLKGSMPDPSHLKDMDKAVSLVAELVKDQKKIGIFGDYDVDGATSSSLLVNYLNALDVESHAHIPDRVKDGYGPNMDAFRNLKALGCAVVITVDCGTTSFEVLQQAHDEGINVIVLDHHVGETRMPPACALVNPNRFDEDSALTYLSAVGLTYLFIVALNRTLRAEGFFETRIEPDLLQFLDLVALGTVCDVVPLLGLNRSYVRQGLKILQQRQNLGLKALCDVAGIHQRPSAYHLGFILGPRINAGGRVGTADLGMRLLTTKDPLEALAIARELDALNKERQHIENEALDEAYQQAEALQEDILIVSGSWHQGIIGIVAGRLKERYHKPSLVVTFDEEGIGKGSGRSIEGINLGSLMHAAKSKGLLINGGGHAMAAGFTVHRDHFLAFKDFLCEAVSAIAYEKKPTLRFDGFLTLKAVSEGLMDLLEQVAPFGQSNPSPVFVLTDVFVKKITLLAQGHISCILGDMEGHTLRAFAFKAMDSGLGAALLNHGGRRLNCVGSLKVNAWGGEETVQFTMIDATDSTHGEDQHLSSAGSR